MWRGTMRDFLLSRLALPASSSTSAAQVFEHGGQVDRRTGTDARGVLASLQVAGDTADRELQARLGGSARRLLAGLSFTASGHFRECLRFACDDDECAFSRGATRRANRSTRAHVRCVLSRVSERACIARRRTDARAPSRAPEFRKRSARGALFPYDWVRFAQNDRFDWLEIVRVRLSRFTRNARDLIG